MATPTSTWSAEALRALAAAVFLDALRLADEPRARDFLIASSEPWRTHRRRWLELLTADVEAAEAGLARLVALPAREREARLVGEAPTRRVRRWDRTEAFPGTLELSRHQDHHGDE